MLVALAGPLLVGCGHDGSPSSRAGTGPGEPTGIPRHSPGPTVPPAPVVQLPAPAPWTPLAGEVEPDIKVVAARVVEALGTFMADGPTAEQRLSKVGADPAMAASGGPLIPAVPAAVTRIVYPQYGGLTDQMASVMVVAEQTWPQGAELVRRTVTTDVRVRRTDGVPRVVDLRIAVTDAAVLTPPPGPAAELVAAPRVALPDAAVADLVGGVVDPLVVGALLALAPTYRMDVSVFRSGHPDEVFGTRMTSNHTRGRAVDVWAIDGVPVVSMSPGDPLLLEFLDAARATGSDEVGGPVDRDGPGGSHFGNALHRDHVHLGFDV